MTQAQTDFSNRGSSKPSSDIYTVLVIVAALALMAAVGFVWYRSQVVFGTDHPFEIREPVAAVASMLGLA